MRVDGDQRENAAAAIGAAIAAIYQSCELALLTAVTAALRTGVPLGAVTMGALSKLRRQTAMLLAAAEAKARQLLDRQGVPFDSPTVYPGPGVEPDLGQLGGDDTVQLSGADLAALTGQQTGPSLRDSFAAISARVYREIPDLYQTAVIDAVSEMRGSLPAGPHSPARIEAAQSALNTLTEHGITGFTDRAGRNWDLISYLEMATRTAASNAWDNVLNAAMLNAGQDLIWTFTDSTEGSCPLCIPWLGRVLSLTGSTTGLVSISDHAGQMVKVEVSGTLNEARAAGFRHPNCRCGWVVFRDGEDLTPPQPSAEAQALYEASQRQRAMERNVRAAGRRASTAMTPEGRQTAKRDLAAARLASRLHREQHGLHTTKIAAWRREHPYRAH